MLDGLPNKVGRSWPVQENFGDYVVLDPHHFVVPVTRPAALLQPSGWDFASWSDAVARTTEGLAALALSLRRRFQIRCRAAAADDRVTCVWGQCPAVRGLVRHWSTRARAGQAIYDQCADDESMMSMLWSASCT